MPKPKTDAWRRPIIALEVPLEGDYAGRTLQMRRNPPLALLDRLDDLDDVPAVRSAVRSLIISHDLLDDDGAPLELDATCSQLTGQELWAIVGAYYRAVRGVSELPKDADAGSATGTATEPSSTS